MIEFMSPEFVDKCVEEITKNGKCLLREHRSRMGGDRSDYILNSKEELNNLPVRSQSLWVLYEFPPLVELDFTECLYFEEDDVTAKLLCGKFYNIDSLDGELKVIVESSVYVDGKAVMGAY